MNTDTTHASLSPATSTEATSTPVTSTPVTSTPVTSTPVSSKEDSPLASANQTASIHPNVQLIKDFYQAFQQLDWQKMSSFYAPDAHFSDSVFIDLKGEDIGHMWHMLCVRAQGFELHFANVQADDTHGSARWQASYIFSQTGRRVKNIIYAEFQFADGKITRHSDHFNFWRWSTYAMGPLGLLLGWSGFMRRKVQQKAGKGLTAFKRKL